jgi:hypothetical protein
MSMIRLQSLSAVASLTLLAAFPLAIGAPALAQPAPVEARKPAAPENQCFPITEFQNWRAADAKTMYLRVGVNDYFRIDMSGECPELTYPDAHLITVWRGSSEVCGALDWDLKVADGTGPGSFAVPCIVKNQTRLTPAEAAAIPKKFKP